jgi:hypothetical protein
MNWVKENIKPTSAAGGEFPITYVSRPDIKDHEEMHLMSLCHHHIIANSTFSWWGAWLSMHPHKVVIAPKHWVNDPSVDTSDVLPENWTHI